MPFDGREFGQHSRMLEKLEKVVGLLRAEDKWCQHEMKTGDGRHCILGALVHVGANSILGDVILRAANEVTGKAYGSVDAFNDDPETDHTLVRAALIRSRENILLGKAPIVPMVTVERRVRMFYSALARLGR
jgi:hypothetical protein